jgi:protein-S-isoprenylcysteine O-methyltransferase Ste14
MRSDVSARRPFGLTGLAVSGLDMANLALTCWAIFGLVALLGRALLQRLRTRSWGVSGVSGSAGSVEWLAGVLFVVSLALGVAGSALQLAGAVEPIEPLDGTPGQVAGLVLFGLGLTAVAAAQLAMGSSWRIGVEETERTELVTSGPFAIVRNPIYSANIPTVGGIVLIAPNIVAVAGFLLLVLAQEMQVRLIEEPYLLRTHGDAYDRYASRVGRFVPGVGSLSTRSSG